MKIGDPPLSPLPAGRQALEKGDKGGFDTDHGHKRSWK